ncbi:MAG: hypothetical protein L0H73_07510 [Nitrococcus sp.]|nr:hypothetical protein [Nitrococcus sp.]
MGSLQDRDGPHPVMASTMAKYPSVETVFVDSAYTGRCAQAINQQHDINVDVALHPANANVGRWCIPEQGDRFTRLADAKGFLVLPKRRVVERTHAWNERARRLNMHHDWLTDVSEAWVVWLAEARMLLRRLTTAICKHSLTKLTDCWKPPPVVRPSQCAQNTLRDIFLNVCYLTT